MSEPTTHTTVAADAADAAGFVHQDDLARAHAWWQALSPAAKVVAASAGGQRRLPALSSTRAAARSDGPETMHEAAASLSTRALSAQRADVVFTLAIAGARGMADFELEQQLGWLHQTTSARRKGLLDDGWIAWTGVKVTNPHTGRSANLYALTPDARTQLHLEKQ